MDCEATCPAGTAPEIDDPFQIIKLNGYAFIIGISLFGFGIILVIGITIIKRSSKSIFRRKKRKESQLSSSSKLKIKIIVSDSFDQFEATVEDKSVYCGSFVNIYLEHFFKQWGTCKSK